MPAVLCSLGPVRAAVDATDAVTDTIVTAVTAWTDHTVPTQHPRLSTTLRTSCGFLST